MHCLQIAITWLCLVGLCNLSQGYPMALIQNPRLGKLLRQDGPVFDGEHQPIQMMLRFCRYCLSQSLICGEMHRMCYSLLKQHYYTTNTPAWTS